MPTRKTRYWGLSCNHSRYPPTKAQKKRGEFCIKRQISAIPFCSRLQTIETAVKERNKDKKQLILFIPVQFSLLNIMYKPEALINTTPIKQPSEYIYIQSNLLSSVFGLPMNNECSSSRDIPFRQIGRSVTAEKKRTRKKAQILLISFTIQVTPTN